MSLLEDLVKAYAKTDLQKKFAEVGFKTNFINTINWPHLKEASLAQWLYTSANGTRELALTANNFANLPYRPEMAGFADKISTKLDPDEPANSDFCKFSNVDKFITGYWKFLTRPPYQGLEENTNSSETFLGFITQQGFASDPGYVQKILALIPTAKALLVEANGGKVSPPPDQLTIVSAPKTVEVGVSFKITGTAKVADRGKTLTVNLGDQVALSTVVVNNTGQWQFNGVFNQAGDRTITISNGTERVMGKVRAIPSKAVVSKFKISNSVGVRGINRPVDVKAVKARLQELGYDWAGDPNDGKIKDGTIFAIRLFQSIVYGASTTNNADGRIDVGGFALSWLQASNAPRWTTIPATDQLISLFNFEQQDTNDNHDYGTDWLATALRSIAKSYHQSFRAKNPARAPLAINDASIPQGGDTPDHAGHETGLMCDLMLPQQNGQFGGITFRSQEYDQRATRAMLVAIKNYSLVRKVLFNDPDLIAAGWCNPAPAHDDHIHFEISPPPRH
jgi:Mannosyl-glycoprotein endo-beta-N-acetylglucosaminidase